jgi:hypothetical protein
MASTYSDLKIELIGTGEQAGTWGNTTNINLGTALQEAITGSADVAFSSGDVTLTLTNSNAAQVGRNLRLNLTGTSGGARNLILGAEMQVEKLYLINNTLLDAVTVKNTTGTGIAVPAGKTMFVFNNGTNVVDAIDNLPSGATVGGVAISTASGTVTSVSGTGTVNGISLSGTVTSSGNITLGGTLANVDLTSQVTGTLPVANGGTGITSLGTNVATFLGTPSSANLAAAVTDETGSGSLVFATSPTFVTPVLGTPTSGTLSNCTVDGTDAVGFRNIPQNSRSAAYTLVLADAGKHILHPSADTTARTFTIPANSSVAYPIGTALTFINQNGAGVVTIAITTDTMRLSPAGTTGSRTLAANGSATCIKITSTEWIISGSGLT